MEVKLAVVADAANVSREGKLNILGAFTTVYADEVPCRHPEMVLVLNAEASSAESGSTKKLEIKLLAADGEQVGGLALDFTVAKPAMPGRPVRLQTVIRLTDTAFPEFGEYAIHILINGEEKATVPISVVQQGGGEDGH